MHGPNPKPLTIQSGPAPGWAPLRPTRVKSGHGLIALLGAGFLVILHLQLVRSMTVDAYSLVQTRLDLLGYFACEAIAVFLILNAVLRNRYSIPLFTLVAVLVLYIAGVVVLTAPDESLVALLASRFGLLTWVVIGAGFAGMIDSVKQAAAQNPRGARTMRRLYVTVLAVSLAGCLNFALGYLARPTPTTSYQSVANSGMLILLTAMMTIDALWPQKKPFLVLAALMGGGTLLTTAIMLTQSTAIAGFWVAVLLVFLAGAITRISPRRRLVIALFVGVGAALFFQTDFFHELIRNTRFRAVLEGGGELSSARTRFDLLSEFPRQFAISPIFGHWRAEVEAGSGWGNYLHSLLLSFLTHTGLVGTLLMLLTLAVGLRGRLSPRTAASSEVQYGRYMLVVFVLGIAFTFLTWSVFWFMLGFLCRRPQKRTLQRPQHRMASV